VIADGGITSSGDVAKAIAAGADTVMLEGCSPAPTKAGEVILETVSASRSTAAWVDRRMKARGFSKDATSRATSRTYRTRR